MEYHVREVTFIFLFGLLQFLLLPLTYVRTETKLLYFSCIGFYSVAASSPEQLRVRLQPSNTKKAHAHTNCKLNYAYFNAFFMLLQFGSWQKSMSCNRRSANWCHTYISQRSLNPKWWGADGNYLLSINKIRPFLVYTQTKNINSIKIPSMVMIIANQLLPDANDQQKEMRQQISTDVNMKIVTSANCIEMERKEEQICREQQKCRSMPSVLTMKCRTFKWLTGAITRSRSLAQTLYV